MKKLLITLILLFLSFDAMAATKSIVPRADSEGGIGTSSKNWQTGYIENIYADKVGVGTTNVNGSASFMNGNVGVGTWIPRQALEVNGTAQMTGFKLTTNPSAGYVLTSTAVGVGTWMPAAAGGSESTTVSDTTTVDLVLTGSDITANGLYTAGDALTLTGADIDFDGGTAPAGELGGTWASPTIDATHSGSAHHSAVTVSGTPDYITLSGQDIVRGTVDVSDDTNLTAGDHITLTGDDLDIDDDYLLNTGDTGSGGYVFTGNIGIGTTLTAPGTGLAVVGLNVGIGTWSPTSALQVVGSIASTNFSGTHSGTSSGTNTGDQSEASIEAIVDLEDLQGAVTDAQVPNTITIDNATTAANLGADGVDALTEIAQGIKTAADDTSKLVVGTAGSNNEIAKWNTDGTLSDNNVILGTMTDGKWCSYASSGTLLSCTQDAPAGSGDITDVFSCASGDCASITMAATDLLDMSGTDASTTTEGLILPQHATACAGGTADGQVCWEVDANILHIGDGATIVDFVPTSAFSADATVSTTGAVTVANDSHDHTTTTVSGLDISADTNLTAGDNLTLTDDDLDLDAAVSIATSITSPAFISSTADPADAGIIRFANNEGLAWEASPAGTDVTMTVDSSEVVQIANGTLDGADLTSASVTATQLGTDSVSADELNATGVETELESTLDIAGEVSSTGMSTTVIADSVTVTGWTMGTSDGTTPTAGDNDTSLATTAFVNTALASSGGGWQDGGTNVFLTLTSDVVGIGTTTPNSNTGFEVMKNSTKSPFMISSVATGAGDYFLMTSAGNIGIGTRGPRQKLEVSGTIDGTTLTEGTNAVYNSTETPGGELGGTWASPTIDDTLSVADWVATSSFQIPNGAAPTVDAAGEVAVDTTSDQLVYYGGAKRVVGYEEVKCVGLADATNVSGTGYFVMIAPAAVTITGAACAVTGTSATVDFEDRGGTSVDAEAETCDTAGDLTWDETMGGTATLVKGEMLWMDVDASSAATGLIGCVRYVITAD